MHIRHQGEKRDDIKVKKENSEGQKAFVPSIDVRGLQSGNGRPLKILSFKDLNHPPKWSSAASQFSCFSTRHQWRELLSLTAYYERGELFFEKQEGKRTEPTPGSRTLPV